MCVWIHLNQESKAIIAIKMYIQLILAPDNNYQQILCNRYVSISVSLN